MVDNLFSLSLADPVITLPAHLWRGTIAASAGKAVGRINNDVVALRNKFGRGEVLWLLSLAGLGSRIKKEYKSLAALLATELKQNIQKLPCRFKNLQPGMLLKTLRSENSKITVVVNKSAEKRAVALQLNGKMLSPQILFANKGGKIGAGILTISPEETIVIKW